MGGGWWYCEKHRTSNNNDVGKSDTWLSAVTDVWIIPHHHNIHHTTNIHFRTLLRSV